MFGLLCGIHAQDTAKTQPATYKDPARFEKNILAFDSADQKQFPPAGAIVAIGSSSMRGWNATIQADLAPLTIIPRGFGGSTLHDAVHYTDRIVIPYKPRAVILYEGDNDMAIGITPEVFLEEFRAFVKKIHDKLPQARIYVLSIKPSISRWNIWPVMQAANKLLAEECAKNPLLTYVDVATGMLGADGKPRPELLGPDKLHMTRAGYEHWRDVLKPVLMKNEAQHETAAGK
jgi:lysophospholipase L1-like esterase